MSAKNNTFTGRGEIADIAFGIFAFIFMVVVIADPIELTKKDKFSDIIYPKAGDAFLSGWYRTLGRECKPNLHKCKVDGRYF